ncbi:hypothetical protein BCV69DRAFT_296657 [Microstroma glucosiphilum]|uniref:Uncharacterized protein n=1 Tax=Pseudomicrostroma glucosiphilum TaxID=1684307 RepID=A0A316UBV0_9BASI|nr:hypothetical protein BCV69DRAFT_296657 [Pseudomicrostroma glucosiphilum]PWN22676.1 hypothetical protein BCV69DRAFT_296657 [Pseudomicrostroma glucosiphilum]
MAPQYNESEPEIQEDDAPVDSGIDAQAEDERAATGSEQQQAANEAGDLDQDNIIDNSAGVSTRGAKVDAMKQDREIDSDVAAETKADEQS